MTDIGFKIVVTPWHYRGIVEQLHPLTIRASLHSHTLTLTGDRAAYRVLHAGARQHSITGRQAQGTRSTFHDGAHTP